MARYLKEYTSGELAKRVKGRDMADVLSFTSGYVYQSRYESCERFMSLLRARESGKLVYLMTNVRKILSRNPSVESQKDRAYHVKNVGLAFDYFLRSGCPGRPVFTERERTHLSTVPCKAFGDWLSVTLPEAKRMYFLFREGMEEDDLDNVQYLLDNSAKLISSSPRRKDYSASESRSAIFFLSRLVRDYLDADGQAFRANVLKETGLPKGFHKLTRPQMAFLKKTAIDDYLKYVPAGTLAQSVAKALRPDEDRSLYYLYVYMKEILSRLPPDRKNLVISASSTRRAWRQDAFLASIVGVENIRTHFHETEMHLTKEGREVLRAFKMQNLLKWAKTHDFHYADIRHIMRKMSAEFRTNVLSFLEHLDMVVRTSYDKHRYGVRVKKAIVIFALDRLRMS